MGHGPQAFVPRVECRSNGAIGEPVRLRRDASYSCQEGSLMTATTETTTELTETDVGLLDAYWRAANYLAVGQIYLLDNPLLREPLRPEHVKPRLLGHWGTTPGLNLIYTHMNRLIKRHDLEAIFITGPGHGGPGLVAQAYLEGTYSEVYHHIEMNEDGMRTLFRQFSFPGGIPSHVAAEVPGSIHEGGELGYALAHAYGAAFDNPDLLVCCVIGDGEAETGPLAASWHSNKFLNPVRDGAVLPVLHLNGYKIANPAVLARIPEHELVSLLEGYGHTPYIVSGDDPQQVHRSLAAALEAAYQQIISIQREARLTIVFTHIRGHGRDWLRARVGTRLRRRCECDRARDRRSRATRGVVMNDHRGRDIRVRARGCDPQHYFISASQPRDRVVGLAYNLDDDSRPAAGRLDRAHARNWRRFIAEQRARRDRDSRACQLDPEFAAVRAEIERWSGAAESEMDFQRQAAMLDSRGSQR